MYIKIDPFVAGILATVLSEMVSLFVYALIEAIRRNRKK